MPIERFMHPLFEHHRIGVCLDADLEVEALVDIEVAVQRLDPGIHRVAALIEEIELWAGLLVSGEYLRQALLELVADDIALLAQDRIFVEPAEADDVVEPLELGLNVGHGDLLVKYLFRLSKAENGRCCQRKYVRKIIRFA